LARDKKGGIMRSRGGLGIEVKKYLWFLDYLEFVLRKFIRK
jgi:hypothetical protein